MAPPGLHAGAAPISRNGPGQCADGWLPPSRGRLVHRLPLLSRATLWDTGDGWVAISVKSAAGCGVLTSLCAAARTPGLMASRAVRRWKYSTPLSCALRGVTSM
jgi:hypothetical protein